MNKHFRPGEERQTARDLNHVLRLSDEAPPASLEPQAIVRLLEQERQPADRRPTPPYSKRIAAYGLRAACAAALLLALISIRPPQKPPLPAAPESQTVQTGKSTAKQEEADSLSPDAEPNGMSGGGIDGALDYDATAAARPGGSPTSAPKRPAATNGAAKTESLSFQNGGMSGGSSSDLLQKGAVLLDVRSAEKYAHEHLNGAVSLPLSDLKKGGLPYAVDTPLVVYSDRAEECGEALSLLSSFGYTRLSMMTP